MKLTLLKLIPLIIVGKMFILGAYFYNDLPRQVASHWNINGEADGYTDKPAGVFFIPVLSAILLGFLYIVPKLDPKYKNIQKFENYFDGFIIVMMTFMAYLFGMFLAWNLDYKFNFSSTIIPGFAALIFYIGLMFSKTDQNWSIGIRTPWTLANKEVWAKTHKLAAKLFYSAAIISLVGVLFPQLAFYFLIIPIVSVAVFLIFYSYYLGKKH
jgi:uncharacterized membrane protein